jgi:hypothetical protein
MPVSFPVVPANNPALKGKLAAPKQLFGENYRFAVAPVFTRFEAIEWFVWDADVYADELGTPEVIRQAATLEGAVAGLPEAPVVPAWNYA